MLRVKGRLMTNRNNIGSCQFCLQEFSASGITRHLTHCPARFEKLQALRPKSIPEVFHLKASGTHLKEYWLHLEVHSEAFLTDLDLFLRRIWLECCGHLSAFEINGSQYQPDPDCYDGWGYGPPPRSMRVRTSELFEPGLAFQYQYDFGSTTHLELKVIEKRQGCFPKERVALIARNNPPLWACRQCGQPATYICAECCYDYDAWYCDECIKAHLEHEELLMPIVNSPRTGVCAYMGSAAEQSIPA